MSKTVDEPNLPPETEWIDIVQSGYPNDREIQIEKPRRWMLENKGVITMWGEGTFNFNFKRLSSIGHEIGGYRLIVGEEVGVVSNRRYEVLSPRGYVVGFVAGNVCHQSAKEVNPDIRAELIPEEE